MSENLKADLTAAVAEYGKNTEALLEKISNCCMMLERDKCLAIAREILTQERAGNVDGNRLYCNGWRAAAEAIIEKIGKA